ncbi:hypothetical protein CEUSTIGMA_g10898.t1 [Chlamydomonas eustigma]|uniref:Histone chaperone n=1 Tax=Chlamydomonas eustigma TaxID=1157962 RepID=A0A250XKB4_9CHLO|nr:hypothetical protein CEUSTIGMA_g10898.t1 [Chlamydomonas eustigma]|eukprot:GAX83473.1 hypothetical protein CEUSTIGMA_g10898.t1 [Chlamydomonas eustigma]
MAAVNVTSVVPGNCEVEFTAPFSFTIEYECLYPLESDLEWKMTYVGSADDDSQDQLLDSVLVGPVLQGNYKFVFEGNAPDHNKINEEDILGVTVVLLTCSYKGKEFIRIGYYVNNDYSDEELKENPPSKPNIPAITRTLLADHPRVTRFPIDFDNYALPQSAATAIEVIEDIVAQDHENFMDVEDDYARDIMDTNDHMMMKTECA